MPLSAPDNIYNAREECNNFYLQALDLSAMLTVNFGKGYLYVSTSSIIKSTKLENGLSSTIPAIEGSSAPYIKLCKKKSTKFMLDKNSKKPTYSK